MVRGKIHGKAKRLTAAILSALVLMESGVSGVTASYVYAKEQGEFGVAFAIAAILMVLTVIINFAATLVQKHFAKRRSI